MPKNSRPDIQVLEARVVRLKAQLLEYKEIRTYEITKKKLSNVALELQECISIIGDITEQGKAQVDTKVMSLVSDTAAESLSPMEFDDSGDLSDILSLDESPEADVVSSVTYEPKQILRSFSSRIKDCADVASGIIQVNQFSGLLNYWFQTRFSTTISYPQFHYKADRIHEWINLLIFAGGYALHSDRFPSFKSTVNSWIEALGSPKGENWVLPKDILDIQFKLPQYSTLEAVLLEKILKPQIYDESFYPSERDYIAKIVMDNSGYSPDQLTVASILEHCPGLVCTSSFDASRY